VLFVEAKMGLHFEDHTQHVIQLIQAALDAADPAASVSNYLQRSGQRLSIDDFNHDLGQGDTFLVAIGKAAIPMGLATAEILGDALTAGVLVTKSSDKDWSAELADSVLGDRPSAVNLMQGGHPISDAGSVAAADAVIELLANTKVGDLVLCLISGGASAIHASPVIPLPEWQQLNDALLASGCNIRELNSVRRQLDRVKGGGLASYAAPAACISLILSDVVGNPIEVIGSGPTVLHHETAADALSILSQYDIPTKLDPAVWAQISAALGTETVTAPSTPRILHNFIIGDVRQAALAAMVRAAQMGFVSQILTTRLQGEAREVAHVIAAIAQELPPGRCLILGGETTVTVKGSGRGGRNQELALAAAIDIDGCERVVIATFATDGEDGPTSAAGALVTGNTLALGRAEGLIAGDYLHDNNSHTFFCQLDQIVGQTAMSDSDLTPAGIGVNHLIETGATGTNVNDLLFILTYPAAVDEQAE
jgi:glycerate 2-kinase